MAPLPKRRHSSARQGKRRAAISLTSAALAVCPNCGKMKLPHTVCPFCGTYSGRVVAAPKVKTIVKKVATEKTSEPQASETPAK